MSPRSTLRPTLVGVLLAAAACNRYELGPAECPPDPEPHSSSAIGWESMPRWNGRLDVRVVTAGAEEPLIGVRMRLRHADASTFTEVPQREGRFGLEKVKSGTYVLEVMRLGYERANAPIAFRGDSGVRATVVMAQSHLELDGCGLVVARFEKPWWKLW